MLGVQILWWGRIGKIVSMAGALTILADLAGPARLSAFGSNLEEVFKALSWLPMYLLRRTGLVNFGEDVHSGVANFVAFLMLLSGYAYLVQQFLWSNLRERYGVVIGAFFVVVLWVVFCLAVISASALAAAIPIFLGWALDKLVIGPLARVLSSGTAAKRIEVTGLLVTLLGFHFDLLSS
ncbi:hypothetical protein [Actinoplanes ianthinogenes]|nr:hypothetical protein [Actinoplanes ianthinogenes]